MSLNVLSDGFLIISLELWVLGKKTTEVKYTSHHILSEGLWCHHGITGDFTCDHFVKIAFARFLHCKATISPSIL